MRQENEFYDVVESRVNNLLQDFIQGRIDLDIALKAAEGVFHREPPIPMKEDL